MSNKSERIAVLVGSLRQEGPDAHYRGFFDCFNRQLYYEAHEVLEFLWLKDRQGTNGAFYKGLIQLAGAFVHLQKNRPGPAAALFRLALANLEKYPARHERLDLNETRLLIEAWLKRLTVAPGEKPLLDDTNLPRIELGGQ